MILFPTMSWIRRLTVISGHLSVMRNVSTNGAGALSEEDVLLEKINDKGLITLNRPKALNALNLSMVQRIQPQLDTWVNNNEVNCVIIKGAGDKAFCAGGDIRAIADARYKEDKSIQREFFKEEYILNNTIGTLKVPWIALIDGITMGGGVGLSVHGKYRIATEKTLFAMPEMAIGLFPDVGGGHFLPRLGLPLGVYLALTGFRLRGRDVLHAGVATHFVESAKVAELEEKLLELTPCNEETICELLAIYQSVSKLDSEKEFCLKPHLADICRSFEYSTVEKIIENLKEEDSDWARKQIGILLKMSPTSLKVALRQLRLGSKMTLQEDLVMEYRLSQRFMEDHDFFEGVRAVVIEKDQKPRWKPASLAEVTDEKIDRYFEALPAERELVLTLAL